MDKLYTTPLVSVVMAAYNCEKYIRQAVDSILSQSFKDFEFIIINDASNDKTETVITSYNDLRIVYICNKENIGQTKSLNEGIKLSRGKYIARMDNDDFSLPNRIFLQVEFMEKNPKVAILGSWVQLINEKGRTIKVLRYPLTPNFIRLLLINLLNCPCLAHPAVMIRKEIFSRIGLYNEKYSVSQDYDLWLRASREYLIRNIPEVLLNYRVNKYSASRINSQKTKGEICDILLSYIKFYLPELNSKEQDLLLDLLIFSKQKRNNEGEKAFEVLEFFFEAIRKKDGERLKIPAKEYSYLFNIAQLFYLPRFALTNRRFAIKSLYKLFPRYHRWILSPLFLKTVVRALLI